MISVKEAKKLVIERVPKLFAEKRPVTDSLGYVLSEQVLSPSDHPAFDQTAVDGYAFQYDDSISGQPLTLIGEIKAGDAPDIKPGKGQAVRIFTGAPVPPGADTVIMQEFTERIGDLIELKDPGLKKGGNIRRRGEQIVKGAVALSPGERLSATHIGFLASIGIDEILVSQKPKVGIIVTGDEFANDISELEKGKIFESNGQMLSAVLQRQGFTATYLLGPDNPESLQKLAEDLLSVNDFLIFTGGVSVGDFDFTVPVIKSMGFEVVFHKVNQKPGKPLLFAKKENKIAFGLPGNPRAVMVCFQEYVLPALFKMMGATQPFPRVITMPMAEDFRKKEGRSQFLAVQFSADGAKSLDNQESHMLQSLARCDGLIWLPEEAGFFPKGSLVEVHLVGERL